MALSAQSTPVLTCGVPGVASGVSIKFLEDNLVTGGKKLASVNVADLFEVYPELAPNGYKTWLDEDENKDAEQDFAKNILLAAEYNIRKKALKSLPKIKNNKEDK